MTAKETLREMLVADLPKQFIVDLKKGLQHVYKESAARAMNDPAWGEAGTKHMYGQYRYVLTNELLLSLANKYQILAKYEKTETESTEYMLLRTRRMSFTISHVSSPKAVPIRACHREQYSKINDHLPQIEMFEDSTIDNHADIYSIICHGECVNKSGELGFVGFSFPNDQGNRVLDHVSIEDISEIQSMQAMTSDERDIELSKIQKTDPVLKQHIKKMKKKG